MDFTSTIPNPRNPALDAISMLTSPKSENAFVKKNSFNHRLFKLHIKYLHNTYICPFEHQHIQIWIIRSYRVINKHFPDWISTYHRNSTKMQFFSLVKNAANCKTEANWRDYIYITVYIFISYINTYFNLSAAQSKMYKSYFYSLFQ